MIEWIVFGLKMTLLVNLIVILIAFIAYLWRYFIEKREQQKQNKK